MIEDSPQPVSGNNKNRSEPYCPKTHAAADAFWRVWRKNGVSGKHGYYESTWMAIDAALQATEEKQPLPDEEWNDFLDRLAQTTGYEA